MKKGYSYAPNPFLKMPRTVRKLPVANAVYIVDRDSKGKKVPAKEFKRRIKEVEDKFVVLFGGFTNDVVNHGEFMSRVDGQIISEHVARITSFCEISIFKKYRKELLRWLIEKKREWKQEAIAFEFEGDLFTI